MSKRRYRSPRQVFSTSLAIVMALMVGLWTLGIADITLTGRISADFLRVVVGVTLLVILLIAALWEW